MWLSLHVDIYPLMMNRWQQLIKEKVDDTVYTHFIPADMFTYILVMQAENCNEKIKKKIITQSVISLHVTL